MSHLALAFAFMAVLILLDFWQVDILFGSIGEYWKRTDTHARTSKLLFAVSLCACALILIWPTGGVVGAGALLVASLLLSMNEWKS